MRTASKARRPRNGRATTRRAVTDARAQRLLAEVGVFAAVDPDTRAQLIKAGRLRTYPRDAVLWRDGQRVKFVYAIVRGRVGLFDVSAEQFTVIDLFQPGDLIASGSTLQDMPYLFSGKVIDEVLALAIPMASFRRQVRRSHSLLFAVALNLVRQWRQIMFQVRNLKQLSANQRLGFYLLTLTDQRSGAATIQLRDDQVLIAGMVGVTRESLSRCFAQLHAEGVRKRGRRVTIDDMGKLRAFCEAHPLK